MAKINPDHLLDQAARLLEPRLVASLIRQVDRRRAISSAYYAVFHLVAGALADELVGTTLAARNSHATPLYAEAWTTTGCEKFANRYQRRRPMKVLLRAFRQPGLAPNFIYSLLKLNSCKSSAFKLITTLPNGSG